MSALKRPTPSMQKRRSKVIARVPSERDVPRWVRLFGAPLVGAVSLLCSLFSLAGRPLTQTAACQYALAAAVSQGQMPYRDMFTLQAPGAVLLQRIVLSLLGSSATSIWLLDSAFVLLASLVIFFIARRFFVSTLIAVVAGISYPMLYYGISHETPGLAEGWALTCWLASIHLITVKAPSSLALRAALSGALFCAAVLIQPLSALMLPIALICLVLQSSPAGRWRCLTLFFAAAAASLLAPVIWLGAHHALDAAHVAFLQTYPQTLAVNLAHLFNHPLTSVGALLHFAWGAFGWSLPGAFAALAGVFALHRKRYGPIGSIIWLWLALSLAAVLLAGGKKPEQWLNFLPVWCLLGGCGYELLYRRSTRLTWRRLASLLFITGAVTGMLDLRQAGQLTPVEQTLELDASPLAAFVKQHTRPQDAFLVWAETPQIYLLAGRPIAGGLPCALEAVESPAALRFFVHQLDSRPPRMVLIRRPDPGDTFAAPYLPPRLPQLERLLNRNYVLADTVHGYEIFVTTEPSPQNPAGN